MADKKSLFLNLLILLFSVVISLALLEGLLRIKNSARDNYNIEMWRYSNELKIKSENPVLGHEHRPSASAVLQKVEIRINRQGLRGEDIPLRSEGRRRILFLGDSITLGWGVPEEETVTKRLEAMFRESGANMEVLNAGIGNYNAVRYVERFLTKLQDIYPSDIVVQYFINDAEVLEPGGGNLLLRNSQLAVTLWAAASRIFASGGEKGFEEYYKSIYDPRYKGYLEMKNALKKLANFCREKNIRLYMAMTPDVHDLKDYSFHYIHKEMEKIAAELGYVYIDLFPGFEDLSPEKVWNMPGDPHPNSLGHKIMAEMIFPVLTSVPRK